ncbi:MAG: NAD(P)/FAD-dependent oxidoreductase [Actinomycetota bacterium]
MASVEDPIEHDDIVDAVADADVRVLLMVVAHATGDRRWLEPPFTPRRDVRLIADEDAGLPAPIADEIRQAVVELVRSGRLGPDAEIADPGDQRMVQMMSVCLGQEVPPEYAPLVREELGFASRAVEWPADTLLVAAPERSELDHEVLVVGAGSSGIALSHRLGELGIDHTIVERESSVGGVWRDNRYPGAGVDTPNHAYSYSFAPPRRWSRYFALQPELEQYLTDTADRFGVTDRIEFDTTVVGARWNDEAARWEVELRTPDDANDTTTTRTCRVLVSAIGQLNVPVVPDLPGLERFEGPAFHSSRWPDDLDVHGRRVAVVGSGASANQIVPAIADRVEQLTIVQRTAQWARPIPRYHDEIPAGSQWLFEHVPLYAKWFRFSMWWRYGDGLLPHLERDPDWPRTDSINRVNERHRQEMAQHIVDTVGDRPDLLAGCMPTYPPYGKRIVLDNGWFDALTRPSVRLVPEAAAGLTESGVVDAAGEEHEVDVVVFATGFEVFQGAARLGIVGRDGRTLADEWADDDPTTYLGISVPGFPNFFLLQGPTTGLGHGGSAIFQAECQVRHITSCLAELARRGARTIEPKEAPTAEYNRRFDEQHERLIWTHPAMKPWYRNDAGRVVAILPWRLVDFWAMTHDVDVADHVFR